MKKELFRELQKQELKEERIEMLKNNNDEWVDEFIVDAFYDLVEKLLKKWRQVIIERHIEITDYFNDLYLTEDDIEKMAKSKAQFFDVLWERSLSKEIDRGKVLRKIEKSLEFMIKHMMIMFNYACVEEIQKITDKKLKNN